MYADDTQLYVSFKTSDRHTAMENTGMAADRVRKWFALNGLMLNPDKTEVMLVGTSQNLASSGDCSSFDMSGSSVRLVDQVKSLGVTIDNRLNFDKHISNIYRASYMNIKALRQIRSSLDRETANSVACALVTTRLDYCNSILHGMTQSNLFKLQRIQNALARVVCVRRKYDHASPLLKKLHWLLVRDRITHKIICMTFKARVTGQPSYLSALLAPYQPSRVLRSSNQERYIIPFVRTVTASRAFSVAAPKIWKELPIQLRMLDTFHDFSRKLKTFFI